MFFIIEEAKTAILDFLQGTMRVVWPLMTDGLPLIKSVLAPLAKSTLILLGLTAAASTTEEAIQKKSLEDIGFLNKKEDLLVC